MTDRERLNNLKELISYCQREIDSITTHSCGKKYWEMLKELIEEYIRYKNYYRDSYEFYKIYNKIHRNLTSTLDIKTRAITKSEYIKLLHTFETTLNYKIRDYYLEIR